MARPAKEKLYLYDKRRELIWALEYQGYNGAELGVIFNVDRSQISRELKDRPEDWEPKWIKRSKR